MPKLKKENDSTKPPPQGKGGVQSVARALAILEFFNERRPQLAMSEITNLSGLSRGTTYRFCRTLMSLGYLEEVGPSEFRLGIRCISLAQAALGSHEIIQIAMPYLDALRNQVGESVNMAILDDTDIVYVVRLLNDDLVTMRLSVGSRLPAYSTSLGRAILAFLPEKESQAILDRSDIRAITSATLIHRTDIETALKHIRKEGYAYNGQGVAMGVHGIAAPVLGANGRPLAAINLSIARPLTEREVTRLASHIMSTAMQIAERGRELHAK